MKVLFIRPYSCEQVGEEYTEVTPSIALLYLSGALIKAGHQPEIVDLSIHRPWKKGKQEKEFCEELISEKIAAVDPGLVAFTCLYSGNFPFILEMSRFLKEKYINIPIAIGGMHPTIFAKEIIEKAPQIDYIIIGEGEEQIVGLASMISQDNLFEVSQIHSIAYRNRKGEAQINPRKSFIKNLDTLPVPAYDLINFKDYYVDTSNWHNGLKIEFNMSVPMVTSRGCPFQCNFCCISRAMGPTIRLHSPRRIVNEIEMIHNRYQQSYFHFMDDNLVLRKSHILGIGREIIRRNLNIQFGITTGMHVASLDEEVIDVMCEAGWIWGSLSIESGSDFIRNEIIGKNLSDEKIYEVARLCARYPQLNMSAFFIIGFPEETWQTLEDTMEMIRHLESVNRIRVFNLMPYAGTKVFEQALRDDLFTDKVDIDNLWKTTGFYTYSKEGKLEDRFYIKPYNMTMSELQKARRIFDKLLR
jgi:magnesium-protoporphyrin IX monomethyl ester (oxidative) cyclase